MKNRIVMMGTPEFAVASLNALTDAGLNVCAVITAPDRPAGRGNKLRSSAMSERTEELGIPTLKPTNLKDPEFLAQLQELRAELFVVVAFRMLPESVWQMPPLGTVNLHGSLLPDYRGAAPINRALMNGESKTGVTTFFIKQQIDTGDIIDQKEITIGPNETAGELHDRMKEVGASLLVKTVKRILEGSDERYPQVLEHDIVKGAPKIHAEDRRIDWNDDAQDVHNHIRGLSPYPGAWSQLVEGEEIDDFKILRSVVTDTDVYGTPGKIQVKGDELLVKCGIGSIRILELQPPGKRKLNTSDFLRGARLGERALFE